MTVVEKASQMAARSEDSRVARKDAKMAVMRASQSVAWTVCWKAVQMVGRWAAWWGRRKADAMAELRAECSVAWTAWN